ncbi:MAG TPA: GNAT family N-acetyltransferase [Bacteroidia bacterium]|nr:GNAT family N-acetyltransferase [Bacteroidia bacterium]
MQIIRAGSQHAQQVADIYNYYIDNTVITFETEKISGDEMAKRIAGKQKQHEWLVLEDEGQVMGYAYYGTFRERVAYNSTVESTIYLRHGQSGRGYGKLLYAELLNDAVAKGYREIIGGVALPNDSSVQLHEKLGFKKVGHFTNVGLKFDRWIDVAFWQKSLY